MSDDFDDFDGFTVDEAAAAMQAEIDLDNRQAAAEIDAVWVVNWRELDDETAHDVWVDLRGWVEWFTLRYRISPTVIPDCWWKHGWLVEELSALRSAHRALFDPSVPASGLSAGTNATPSRENASERCRPASGARMATRTVSPSATGPRALTLKSGRRG